MGEQVHGYFSLVSIPQSYPPNQPFQHQFFAIVPTNQGKTFATAPVETGPAGISGSLSPAYLATIVPVHPGYAVTNYFDPYSAFSTGDLRTPVVNPRTGDTIPDAPPGPGQFANGYVELEFSAAGLDANNHLASITDVFYQIRIDQYLPEPGVAWLVALTLLGVGLARRKQRLAA